LWGNNVVLRIKLPVTRKKSTLFYPTQPEIPCKKHKKLPEYRIYWEAFVVLGLSYWILNFLIIS